MEGSHRAIIAAFLANLGIAVAKLVGFLVTGAASLAAEAIHSFADTANQGLLFLGEHRAKRAPDDSHPFGYGRERYFWAFVVALVLEGLSLRTAVRESRAVKAEAVDDLGRAVQSVVPEARIVHIEPESPTVRAR